MFHKIKVNQCVKTWGFDQGFFVDMWAWNLANDYKEQREMVVSCWRKYVTIGGRRGYTPGIRA